ncbi:hypothetical protein SEHO0A_04262 [Salmonella enterica subsp. houtenae str. ATCC BAA-1581]|nr:hypothetical protein SEHO0A_04262 [Salmonella enterica subsp. houtenae str. ATCC BAA-1581]ENZ84506.1 Sensor protein of zinc sigma-54-dependent two-component system [Salmonella enterica subsp. houtenae serovar 16:z4,z32:-- str. RKS3027]
MSGCELTRFRRQKASKNDSHDLPGESFLPAYPKGCATTRGYAERRMA